MERMTANGRGTVVGLLCGSDGAELLEEEEEISKCEGEKGIYGVFENLGYFGLLLWRCMCK